MFTFSKTRQFYSRNSVSKSHTCALLSTQANLQFKRVTSLYKYDRLDSICFERHFSLSIFRKKVTTRNNRNFIDKKLRYDVHLN